MKPRAPALGKQRICTPKPPRGWRNRISGDHSLNAPPGIGVFHRPFQGLGILAALQPRVPLRSTLGFAASRLRDADASLRSPKLINSWHPR